MDVYNIKQLDQGMKRGKEEREKEIAGQFKDLLFVCQKKCFDFQREKLTQAEAQCYNNCSLKFLKHVIPISN